MQNLHSALRFQNLQRLVLFQAWITCADKGDSALISYIAPFGTIGIIILLRLDILASEV